MNGDKKAGARAILRPSEQVAEAARIAGLTDEKKFLKLLYTEAQKKALKRKALDEGISLAEYFLRLARRDGVEL